MAYAQDNSKTGKLSEQTRARIGTPGSKTREEMPVGAFLLGAERKYPVKLKSGGQWKYDRALLLAAARRARLNGEESLAQRADRIRIREFGDKNGVSVSKSSYSPTDAMRSAAARGLELRQKFDRGGTAVGVARARDLVNGRDLSADTVKRMFSYFSRHEVDKQGKDWGNQSNPSAGYIAWLLWGGDAGASWSKKHADALRSGSSSMKTPAKKSIVGGPVAAIAQGMMEADSHSMPSLDSFSMPEIDFAELAKTGALTAVIEDLALSPVAVTNPDEVMGILEDRRACVVFVPAAVKNDVCLGGDSLYFLTDASAEKVHGVVYASRLALPDTEAVDSFFSAIEDIIPESESPQDGDMPVVLRLALRFDPVVDVTEVYTPSETKAHVGTHKSVMQCRKDASGGKPYFPIVQKDAKKRVIKLLVAEPDHVDVHDDEVPADVIEAAAHDWMMAMIDPLTRPDGQRPKVNLFHGEDVSDRVIPVESYVVDAPITFKDEKGEQSIKAGSWIVGFKIPDDNIWEMVEREEIGGASYEGDADALIFDERFVPPEARA